MSYEPDEPTLQSHEPTLQLDEPTVESYEPGKICQEDRQEGDRGKVTKIILSKIRRDKLNSVFLGD